MVKKTSNRKELLALVLFSLIIGLGYDIGGIAVQKANPFLLLSLEYLIALLFMFAIRGGKVADVKSIRPSFAFGIATFVGLGLSYESLYFIPAPLVAFLTSLGFVFTVVIERLAFSRKVSKNLLSAIILSFLGLTLIFFSNGFDVNLGSNLAIGSILCLIASVAFGFQYIVGSRMTNKLDPIISSFYASVLICIVSFVFFEIQNPFTFPSISISALPYFLYLAIFATAIARILQFFGQKKVPATTTSLIFNLIPIFALVIGIFFGQSLNSLQIMGSFLILGADVVILR
jgi:drug/metabolite transporter (DMT)-like permease